MSTSAELATSAVRQVSPERAVAPSDCGQESEKLPDGGIKTKQQRRWLRRSFVLLCFGVMLFVLRVPILTGLARGLIVDHPAAPADAVALLGGWDGEHGIRVAARMYRRGQVSQVIVFNAPPRRIEYYGIIPSDLELSRRRLHEMGVPEEAIVVLPQHLKGPVNQGRTLENWLREHPGETVVGVGGRFCSRRSFLAFKEALSGEHLEQMRWRSLRDRRFDETDWWRSKYGVLTVFSEYARLARQLTTREPHREPSTWDPDAYEESLRRQVAP